VIAAWMGPRRRDLRHAEFVSSVRTKRIFGHQLLRDLACQFDLNAPGHINLRQLLLLEHRVFRKLAPLLR
jgi:hypothetical protein